MSAINNIQKEKEDVANSSSSQIEMQGKIEKTDKTDCISIDNNKNDTQKNQKHLFSTTNCRQHSILKSTESYHDRTRVDQQGKLILKSGKDHKITFSENLIDVQIVENWKEYNVLEDEEPEQKCNCWLI